MSEHTAPAMPPRVRTWLDYGLAHADNMAGRTDVEAPEYPDSPSADELCAAVPFAADQIERVMILAELRNELYWNEDIIIGELYLAAEQHPDRMDHMYDFVLTARRARKELGPDVVEWLRQLGETAPLGVDMAAAEAMLRGLYMHEEWEELTAEWDDVPEPPDKRAPAYYLADRTVWHDGHWRHKDEELVPLHRAEYEAVVHGGVRPEQLAEWKQQPQVWPQPVKTDRDGPWVVAAQWEEFLRLKHTDTDALAAQVQRTGARAERLQAHLAEATERTERLQKECDQASAQYQRLFREQEARTGPVMREMSPRAVESAIALNRELGVA